MAWQLGNDISSDGSSRSVKYCTGLPLPLLPLPPSPALVYTFKRSIQYQNWQTQLTSEHIVISLLCRYFARLEIHAHKRKREKHENEGFFRTWETSCLISASSLCWTYIHIMLQSSVSSVGRSTPDSTLAVNVSLWVCVFACLVYVCLWTCA